MEEWFRYNNVPFPRLWSIITMSSEHFFEEMIEDGVSGMLIARNNPDELAAAVREAIKA